MEKIVAKAFDKKTKVLFCNSKECKQEVINIGGKSIEIVRKVKYIGEVLTLP